MPELSDRFTMSPELGYPQIVIDKSNAVGITTGISPTSVETETVSGRKGIMKTKPDNSVDLDRTDRPIYKKKNHSKEVSSTQCTSTY